MTMMVPTACPRPSVRLAACSSCRDAFTSLRRIMSTISVMPLYIRYAPPASITRSRMVKSWCRSPRSMTNSVACRCTSQLAKHRKMHRITNAPASPSLRPMCCFSAGRRSVVMEMKTMLSTPRTISRNVRVRRLIHASGVANIEKSMKVA